MSITDGMKDHIALLNLEIQELRELLSRKPEPAPTNIEMSESLHYVRPWEIGPPRMPGSYLVECYDGSITLVWLYGGKMTDGSGEDITDGSVAYHYRPPAREMEARDEID